jgi:hypothetical protein
VKGRPQAFFDTRGPGRNPTGVTFSRPRKSGSRSLSERRELTCGEVDQTPQSTQTDRDAQRHGASVPERASRTSPPDGGATIADVPVDGGPRFARTATQRGDLAVILGGHRWPPPGRSCWPPTGNRRSAGRESTNRRLLGGDPRLHPPFPRCRHTLERPRPLATWARSIQRAGETGLQRLREGGWRQRSWHVGPC